MKILIFGKGYLGNRLAGAWPDAVITDARIEDAVAVARVLDEHTPDAVINCAGKTGKPNVDWCETHQVETTTSNVVGPLVLAEGCAKRNIYLVHIGSGCIFYGASPDPAGWREDDFANPEAFYSRTKYAADLVLSRMPNVAIARIRMPIDHVSSSRNLIDKLASYKQVIDVENSVTVIDDLIVALRALAEQKASGIFHVVNPGIMRHRDLMEYYRAYVDPHHETEWISNDELVSRGLAVRGRSNCILQSNRLAEFGIRMRPIKEALADTFLKYAQSRRAAMSTSVSAPSSAPTAASPKRMKGVICAGGKGTRLAPLTDITNKHLLPIYDKPMVLYPLQTLLDAGITDIMLVTGPDYAHQFMKLLGSGAAYGCKLTYRIQDEAGGIAHALLMAEDFVGDNHCAVILGDNIFNENFKVHLDGFSGGGMVFYKPVANPSAYGIIEIDVEGTVLSTEEKPSLPRSNLAQVGLYVFDNGVFEVVKKLKPSGRGELEITEVTDRYRVDRRLKAQPVTREWWDVGTLQGMGEATAYFAHFRKK